MFGIGPLVGSVSFLGSIWLARMWYSVPLVVAISLVYAATRHEAMKPILDHAFRFGIAVVGFMILVMGILFATSFLL